MKHNKKAGTKGNVIPKKTIISEKYGTQSEALNGVYVKDIWSYIC